MTLALQGTLSILGRCQLRAGGGVAGCGADFAESFFPSNYAEATSGVLDFGETPVGAVPIVLAAFTTSAEAIITPPAGITWYTINTGKLWVFVGVAQGFETSFTMTSTFPITQAFGARLPLISTIAPLENAGYGFGFGELSVIEATTACEFSYGLAILASDAGFATPTQTGFSNPFSVSEMQVWEALDFANSSQSISVSVASSDIYGVILAFYTLA
jgi:hypothetical protein